MAMTLTNLKTLSKKSAFASMDCLLAIYDIEDKISLSALLEFGWETVQHVRLALVLRMSSGMTLTLAPNTTKIPFLIAAQLEDGTAQFLCPVVGESEPRFEHGMCSPSNVADCPVPCSCYLGLSSLLTRAPGAWPANAQSRGAGRMPPCRMAIMP